jgi:hypothetical protein
MTFLAFHEDEAKAQVLAGHRRPGRAAIRPFLPDQHREFFALLSYVFVATPGADGWPMASVLAGEPGFVQSPDPARSARCAAGIGDPAAPTPSPAPKWPLGLDSPRGGTAPAAGFRGRWRAHRRDRRASAVCNTFRRASPAPRPPVEP